MEKVREKTAELVGPSMLLPPLSSLVLPFPSLHIDLVSAPSLWWKSEG